MTDSDSASIYNKDELERLNIDFNNLGITGICKVIIKRSFTKFSDGRYGRNTPINKQPNYSRQEETNSDIKTTDGTKQGETNSVDTTKKYSYVGPLIDSVSGKYILNSALEVMKDNLKFQEGGFLEFLFNKTFENPKISMWKIIKLELGIVDDQEFSLTPEEELLIEECCPDALGVLGYEVFGEYKQKKLEKNKEIPCEKGNKFKTRKKRVVTN